MATAIYGVNYVATSPDDNRWTITRGRFEMGRFIGTIEEVRAELRKWEATVQNPDELNTAQLIDDLTSVGLRVIVFE